MLSKRPILATIGCGNPGFMTLTPNEIILIVITFAALVLILSNRLRPDVIAILVLLALALTRRRHARSGDLRLQPPGRHHDHQPVHHHARAGRYRRRSVGRRPPARDRQGQRSPPRHHVHGGRGAALDHHEHDCRRSRSAARRRSGRARFERSPLQAAHPAGIRHARRRHGDLFHHRQYHRQRHFAGSGTDPA